MSNSVCVWSDEQAGRQVAACGHAGTKQVRSRQSALAQPTHLAHPPKIANPPTRTHLVVALMKHAGACSPHRLDGTLRQRRRNLQQKSSRSGQAGAGVAGRGAVHCGGSI